VLSSRSFGELKRFAAETTLNDAGYVILMRSCGCQGGWMLYINTSRVLFRYGFGELIRFAVAATRSRQDMISRSGTATTHYEQWHKRPVGVGQPLLG
jgi:hypothetical protein